MKILHVLTQLPQKTGSGVYFTNLIDSFKKLGTQNAAVYGVDDSFDIDLDLEDFREVIYKSDELPFPICGMSDVMPYESTVYSKMTDEEIDLLLENFRKNLIDIKEDFDPDIIISHHLFFVTDLVRQIFADKKVVGISHGTDIRQIKKHPRFLSRLGNIKNLDEVLTVTNMENPTIINDLGVDDKKIHLVGGGFNEEIFYENDILEKKDSIDLFYAGKIVESKGVFELGKCLPILEEKYPNLRLHIVGKESDESRRKLEQGSNFSKNLKIYDAKDQREMADILRKMDIFILPSYFEALGLVAIEALACHKLVVASRIEGLIEVLSKDILDSGVIKFVDLPRLRDVDKPYKEDIDIYVNDLVRAIDIQISRIHDGLFTDNIKSEIKNYSWTRLGSRILDLIK